MTDEPGSVWASSKTISTSILLMSLPVVSASQVLVETSIEVISTMFCHRSKEYLCLQGDGARRKIRRLWVPELEHTATRLTATAWWWQCLEFRLYITKKKLSGKRWIPQGLDQLMGYSWILCNRSSWMIPWSSSGSHAAWWCTCHTIITIVNDAGNIAG